MTRRSGARDAGLGVALAAAGLWTLARAAGTGGDTGRPWLWAGTVLVGLAAATVLRAVLHAVRVPRLVLDAYGVREIGPLRVRKAERWEDCVRFSPAGVRVGFQNRAYRQARTTLHRRWLRRGRSYPATLPAGYGGLDRDQLVSLLNRYRVTFTDRRRQAPTMQIDLAQVAGLVDLTAVDREQRPDRTA